MPSKYAHEGYAIKICACAHTGQQWFKATRSSKKLTSTLSNPTSKILT